MAPRLEDRREAGGGELALVAARGRCLERRLGADHTLREVRVRRGLGRMVALMRSAVLVVWIVSEHVEPRLLVGCAAIDALQ
jgi:hypothetical protein